MREKIKFNMEGASIIDMTDHYKRKEEDLKVAQAAWEKAHAAENTRILRLKCPVCKSSKKERSTHNTSNGIMGPGFSSTKIFDHYVCQGCGVHYSDIKKRDIGKYPTLYGW